MDWRWRRWFLAAVGRLKAWREVLYTFRGRSGGYPRSSAFVVEHSCANRRKLPFVAAVFLALAGLVQAFKHLESI
jgi:hypothetical protein